MRLNAKESSGLIALGLLFLGVIGWVMNVVEIFTGSFDPLTGIMVARVIGVFVFPIGMVLGYV